MTDHEARLAAQDLFRAAPGIEQKVRDMGINPLTAPSWMIQGALITARDEDHRDEARAREDALLAEEHRREDALRAEDCVREDVLLAEEYRFLENESRAQRDALVSAAGTVSGALRDGMDGIAGSIEDSAKMHIAYDAARSAYKDAREDAIRAEARRHQVEDEHQRMKGLASIVHTAAGKIRDGYEKSARTLVDGISRLKSTYVNPLPLRIDERQAPRALPMATAMSITTGNCPYGGPANVMRSKLLSSGRTLNCCTIAQQAHYVLIHGTRSGALGMERVLAWRHTDELRKLKCARPGSYEIQMTKSVWTPEALRPLLGHPTDTCEYARAFLDNPKSEGYI